MSNSSVKSVVYYLAVSVLFVHELDAVQNYEWQLLFHVFKVSDALASTLFIAIHFPLFFLFFFLGHHSSEKVSNMFRLCVCGFLIIHGLVHFGLSDHAQYHFKGLLSNAYIFGASFFAMIWFALLPDRK